MDEWYYAVGAVYLSLVMSRISRQKFLADVALRPQACARKDGGDAKWEDSGRGELLVGSVLDVGR